MSQPESEEQSTRNESAQPRLDDAGVDTDSVTRDQNGQYIEESSGLERVMVPPKRASGQLDSQDLESIRAKHVTMNQSGAEQIDAESVTITSGGARSIHASTVDLRNSGAVTVSGENVSVTQSSVVVIAADHVEMSMSWAFAIQADTVTVKGESGSGLLIANTVEAEHDFRAVVGIIGTVSNKANVHLMFDTKSALALGAGLALAFRLLGRIFRK